MSAHLGGQHGKVLPGLQVFVGVHAAAAAAAGRLRPRVGAHSAAAPAAFLETVRGYRRAYP